VSFEPEVSGQEEACAREADMAQLRDAARQMGVSTLRDGSWFRRILAEHVKKHVATIDPDHWERLYAGLDVEERAHRQVVSVARRASAAGALAAIGSSTGELLSLVTDGLATPIGVPAAALSMGLEAGYTALLQIDLACDLASIYGVPFDANDVGEVATLFGLAFGVDLRRKRKPNAEPLAGDDEPRQLGFSQKLMDLEEGEIGTRIGRKLLEDAVMRNVLPVVGVAVSARWNYLGTTKLGFTVKKYVRYRRALEKAFTRLRLDHVNNGPAIVEGTWLLATVDGEIEHEEVLAIALIMDHLPQAQRAAVERDLSFGDDEEEWFEQLASAPTDTHDAILDVLYMIAATDRELQPGERRFLRRVGKTLGRPIDFGRVEQICRHFAGGEELPEGFLSCVR
jgi:tellurite resistance protein